MKILNPIKTFKCWKKWKSIIKLNKVELTAKGFQFDWVSRLGLIVYLKKADIEDLRYIYDENQYEFAKSKFANERIVETLRKHNDFFLDQGLLELIDDEFIMENSKINSHAYYVTFSFRKYYFNKKTIIMTTIIMALLILTYLIYNF